QSMNTARIAIIGHGKMGRAVEDVAAAAGLSVVAVLDRAAVINADSLCGANVAIEFSEPSSAIANAKACIDAECSVVIGTTGWYDQLDALAAYARERDGSILWSANFSLGVHALAQLVREAGVLFSSLGGFDAQIVETHHTAKKDAPSGTALLLQRQVESTLGRPVPITSIRIGSVPGTHELVLDAAFEQIVISHEARDRRVFAEGAIAAARWLVGRRGVFTLADVLNPGD
ncbi:MAG: 4-hydroxy-tetrahydrodipicolinate reductase, partial [Gemmatimonadaceae bacterium]